MAAWLRRPERSITITGLSLAIWSASVEELAQAHDIPVHLTERVDAETIDLVKRAEPDVIVVNSWYTRMPSELYTLPPHGTLSGGVERPYRDIPYDRMVDDFLRALGSGERAERIMVQNPARLYGFDS